MRLLYSALATATDIADFQDNRRTGKIILARVWRVALMLRNENVAPIVAKAAELLVAHKMRPTLPDRGSRVRST